MAGQAGYKVQIKVGGDPVPVVDEACTFEAANFYSITDQTRSAMDRFDPVVVKIDSTIVDSDLYAIDYLFGVILTDPSVTDGTMTIDYSYVPLVDVACATSFNLDIAGDVLDTTCFKGNDPSAGFRTRINGLNDVSASLDKIDITDKTFLDAKLARNALLVEWDFDGTQTDLARGWFIVENDNFSGEVAGLLQEAIQLQLEAEDSATALKSFSWQTE